jgi:hypothetical protein
MSGLPGVDDALTIVLFKPDGRRAKTLRVSVGKLVALLAVASSIALAAIACGWLLGEWTARL